MRYNTGSETCAFSVIHKGDKVFCNITTTRKHEPEIEACTWTMMTRTL